MAAPGRFTFPVSRAADSGAATIPRRVHTLPWTSFRLATLSMLRPRGTTSFRISFRGPSSPFPTFPGGKMRSYFVSRLARRCVGVAVALSLVVVAGSARAGATTTIKTGNASEPRRPVRARDPARGGARTHTSTAGAIIAPHFKVQLRDSVGDDVASSGVSVSVALTSALALARHRNPYDRRRGLSRVRRSQHRDRGDEQAADSLERGSDASGEQLLRYQRGGPGAALPTTCSEPGGGGVAIAPTVQLKVTDSLATR